jgi:hypothetical protein
MHAVALHDPPQTHVAMVGEDDPGYVEYHCA